MGLPSIDFIFKTKAATAISRSARGILAIVVQDATKTDFSSKTYGTLLDVDSADYTADNYAAISRAFDAAPYKVIVVRIGTGEDMYLKESFKPLLESGALAVIHPDILTAGGILETKRIGDLAEEHAVQMSIHMAESPVACLAAVHVAGPSESGPCQWQKAPLSSSVQPSHCIAR